MASQGFWLRSFLVYGLLLQVSKGQNAQYRTLNWNQNRYKQQTTSEPHLGAFDRVNTTDVPEEFEPVTDSSGVVINKPVPGQEMFSDVLNPGQATIDREKVSDTSLPQAITRTKTEPRLGTFDSVSTTDVRKELEPVISSTGVIINQTVSLREIQNYTLKSEYVVTDGRNVIKRQKPAKETQNQITIESQLANLDRTNSTDSPEKFEPKTNNQPQNRTSESQLGISDRINATDVPEEFEPVTNYKDVIINKPVQGQRLYNDILIPERITINRDKINDMSLPQTRMTTKPHQEAFDKTKASDIPKEFEPGTSTRGRITIQPVSGQKMQNYTLKSGNGNMSGWFKQGVGQVQETVSRVKPHNMVVGILYAFKGKNSKDQVQLYSVIGNNQINDSIKARNSKKPSEYKSKDKDIGRKLKKSK
ncbi:hypothetical protein CHS0354_015592 [Potamilus streckersoni]|uniref:Uncharacterized protein n=1 Tax=Potamilus streckersoni TaxID=2493646 RepID=A0AAE0TBT3_9BIVA|nr:hypothetical protein CHS0354_015592 [Potamilus streckersoni]